MTSETEKAIREFFIELTFTLQWLRILIEKEIENKNE
jgi:hypothetical protein